MFSLSKDRMYCNCFTIKQGKFVFHSKNGVAKNGKENALTLIAADCLNQTPDTYVLCLACHQGKREYCFLRLWCSVQTFKLTCSTIQESVYSELINCCILGENLIRVYKVDRKVQVMHL